MIRTLVQIIPALVVGILIGIFLSTQDYSNLREITLGELLNVLTNLFFIGIVTYYIIQVSNTNLKRREMLLGYFDELREKLHELNNKVMANTQHPDRSETASIKRQFKELGIFMEDAQKQCDHSEVQKLFRTSPENFLERWTDYWDIATASPFMSISLDAIPPEQIDKISSSHDALQSRLRSWQMGLYFNTPS